MTLMRVADNLDARYTFIGSIQFLKSLLKTGSADYAALGGDTLPGGIFKHDEWSLTR